jgi:hypothetical protein
MNTRRLRSRRWVTLGCAAAAGLVLGLAGAVLWKPALERHYLRVLETGSADERKVAARRLAALESQRGFERLLELPPLEPVVLCGTDFNASVLIEHGPAALPCVFEALQSDDVRARYRAVRVLAELQPPGATRTLVEALRFEDTHGALLDALARQSPVPGEAVGALRAAIESESVASRQGAARALRRVPLSEEDLDPARRLLEGVLEDPVARVRIESAWSLGEIGPRPESVTLLEALLSDEVDNVRRAAARALAKLGAAARPARPALERALGDRRSSDVRKYAAEALEKIRAEPERS